MGQECGPVPDGETGGLLLGCGVTGVVVLGPVVGGEAGGHDNGIHLTSSVGSVWVNKASREGEVSGLPVTYGGVEDQQQLCRDKA
jgi:hypothetical protein